MINLAIFAECCTLRDDACERLDPDDCPPDDVFYDCIEGSEDENDSCQAPSAAKIVKVDAAVYAGRKRRPSWHGQDHPLSLRHESPGQEECTCRICVAGAEIQKGIELRTAGSHRLPPLDSHDRRALAAEAHGEFADGSAEWVDERGVARLLKAAAGDVKLARSKLRDAVRWRAQVLLPWHRELAAHRATPELQVVQVAVGHRGRPFLMPCLAWQRYGDPPGPQILACRIDEALRSTGASQFDLVLDCFGFQYGLNANVGMLLEVAKALDCFFAERVHRIVLIDMPRAADFLWACVRPVLPPKTKLKIVFVKSADAEAMAGSVYELCRDDDMRAHIDAIMALNRSDCESQAHYKRNRLTYVKALNSMVQKYMEKV